MWACKSLQSCPTLCDPMDCSPSGFSVHGILQARILEWGAMASSRGSSWPRDWTCVSCDSRISGGFFTTAKGRPSRGPANANLMKSWCVSEFRNGESGSTHRMVLINFARRQICEEWKDQFETLTEKNTCSEGKEPNPKWEWPVKLNQISLCLRICGLILCSWSRKREQAFILRENAKKSWVSLILFFLSSFNIEMGSRPN